MRVRQLTPNLIQLTRLRFVNEFLVREDDGFTLVDTTVARGGDAPRYESGLQVFGELGVPSQLAQIESRQRKAPSREMGRRTRPNRRSVRR